MSNQPSQASMQTRFRVNQKPTYSEKMLDTRSEVRLKMKEALREITGDDNAAMRWHTFPKDVIEKYHVTIVGWPDEIPFKNLSDISNLARLDTLLEGWKNGSIRFRQLPDSAVAAESAFWTARIAQLDANSVPTTAQ